MVDENGLFSKYNSPNLDLSMGFHVIEGCLRSSACLRFGSGHSQETDQGKLIGQLHRLAPGRGAPSQEAGPHGLQLHHGEGGGEASDPTDARGS